CDARGRDRAAADLGGVHAVDHARRLPRVARFSGRRASGGSRGPRAVRHPPAGATRLAAARPARDEGPPRRAGARRLPLSMEPLRPPRRSPRRRRQHGRGDRVRARRGPGVDVRSGPRPRRRGGRRRRPPARRPCRGAGAPAPADRAVVLLSGAYQGPVGPVLGRGRICEYTTGLRGDAMSDDLKTKVQDLIDTMINPAVAGHGGFVELIDVQDNRVYLQMGGGCQGCGAADITLKSGIERLIKEELPEVAEVLDTTDHSSGTNPYYSAGKA